MRSTLTTSTFIARKTARLTVFGDPGCEVLEGSAASLQVGDGFLGVATLKRETITCGTLSHKALAFAILPDVEWSKVF